MFMKNKYNWKLIQEDHDNGFTWKELQEKYGFSVASITKAKKRGDFVSRSKSEARKRVTGFTLPEETKNKISQSRKKYLKENPDKVPYKLNHYSKGQSYPEKYFEDWLRSNSIVYKPEESISIYRIDFLIDNIALEIDGEQHYLDERIVLSNKYRDEYLQSIGIKTIRVRWAHYQKLTTEEKEAFLFNLLKILSKGVNDDL